MASLKLTSREQQIWEHGFICGKEDFGAILIASYIEMGRATIKLNELRDIYHQVNQQMPEGYLPEYVMEVLNDHANAKNR